MAMIGLHHLLQPHNTPDQHIQQQQQPVRISTEMSKQDNQQSGIVRIGPRSGRRAKEINQKYLMTNNMQRHESQVFRVHPQIDEQKPPIIGRRAPAKPTGLMGQSRGYTALVQQEMENVAADYLQRAQDKLPVVGRRSHRLQQLQLSQPTIVYQFGDDPLEHERCSSNPMQPLSFIETHIGRPITSHATKQIRSKSKVAGNGLKKKQAAKQQSLSVLNIAQETRIGSNGYYPDQSGLLKCNSSCCLPTAGSIGGDKPSHPFYHTEAAAMRHNKAWNRASSLSSASSCSPLYGNHHQLASPHDLCPGCVPPMTSSSSSSIMCQAETCCTNYEIGVAIPSHDDGCLSPNSGRGAPPCCMIPSSPHLELTMHQPRQIKAPISVNINQGSRSRRSTGHHHHHSCQANGGHMDQYGGKPTSAAHRSSSCQRERQLQPPMIILGQNVLPVHPKPSQSRINGALERQVNRHRNSSCSGDRRDGSHSPVVNQMYESLAAELKAKLGDPKIGPILLPPKDYDTISRKQGKLSGIELRRSTNPQLVGPAAGVTNCRSNILNEMNEPSLSSVPLEIKDNQNLGAQQINEGSSTRSSGRSQDDLSLSHRSRSNSSSGLGSISVGAGSPNSSPSSQSSSSEDMRHHPTSSTQSSRIVLASQPPKPISESKMLNPRLKLNFSSPGYQGPNSDYSSNSRTGSVATRKNCSPDNFGSDSGHSEGSGLMEVATAQEQKIMLRDTSDNLYKLNKVVKNTAKTKLRSNSTESTCQAEKKSPKSLREPHANRESQQEGSVRNRCWGVEIPLKVNRDKDDGNTYLATKQIIY